MRLTRRTRHLLASDPRKHGHGPRKSPDRPDLPRSASLTGRLSAPDNGIT
jgi:hypothetical protein